MSLLHTITLTWWQGGIFKISMIAFGLALGSLWPDFFKRFLLALWAIFILGSGYLLCVWFQQ